MSGWDEDSGRVDLEALMRGAAAHDRSKSNEEGSHLPTSGTAHPPGASAPGLSKTSPVPDPLGTVPHDLALLVTRLSTLPSAPTIPPSDRESLGSMTTDEAPSTPRLLSTVSPERPPTGGGAGRIALAVALTALVTGAATVLFLPGLIDRLPTQRASEITGAVAVAHAPSTHESSRTADAPTTPREEHAAIDPTEAAKPRSKRPTTSAGARANARSAAASPKLAAAGSAGSREEPTEEALVEVASGEEAVAGEDAIEPSEPSDGSEARDTDRPSSSDAILAEGAPEPSTPEGADEPSPASAPPAPVSAPPLERAMRDAVGHADAPAEAATTRAAGVGPSRPSLGAVAAALRAALPAARKCLAPTDAARSPMIVFARDGSVRRVELMGATPEDACVRAAFSTAKVPPFREETFSTRVVVRP